VRDGGFYCSSQSRVTRFATAENHILGRRKGEVNVSFEQVAHYTSPYTSLDAEKPMSNSSIRDLLAHSAAKFNILPGRWQHVWLVAIVPPERWGKVDRNDSHTA
jgi:hypothetical protein